MVVFTGDLSDFGRGDLADAGGKAANLGELVRAGLPVPPGFVITTAAYRRYVAHNDIGDRIAQLAVDPANADAIRELFRGELPAEVRAAILTAYGRLGSGTGGTDAADSADPVAVAVRSSATAEDLAEASFAGQQDTFLDVVGPVAVLSAVERCWASLWTARAMEYRARQGVDPDTLSLAVVVQTLVDADCAGVMFTANPLNGRRVEVLIGAAWGLGEAVVGGLVNTDQVVVATAGEFAGRVLSRETADKQVETVRIGGATAERPVPPERRRLPVLDDAAAAELAAVGARIESHFGVPQDIEWARAGGVFAILQSRPITALPLPESDPPTEWPVPDPSSIYARASIVEQLPDPLSPLFADLVDGSVSRSLSALMNEFVGENGIRPGEISLPTINGYAYYAYRRSAFLRLLLLTPRALPVLSARGPRSGRVRWRERAHPRYRRTIAVWSGRDPASLTDAELLDGVRELLDAGTEYYTSVQTIIPIAAMSEVLFTRFYEGAVRRAEDPPAATFLLGYDSLPIRAEKSLFDLSRWVLEQPELTRWLLATSTAQIVSRLAADGWPEFGRRFADHVAAFGHMVYNLDFVNPVPADDPAPLIDTLRFYLQGEGGNPYVRQQRAADRREVATQMIMDRVDPVRARIFAALLRRAQEVAPEREDALGDVGLAWPPMRRLLAELGTRLAERGIIPTAADVYWLQVAELDTAGPVTKEGSLAAEVEHRQELWRGRRRAVPPQSLPKGSWMDAFERFMPAATGEQTGDVLTGIGASAGRVTAIARVLGGPDDFARLAPGEVLVASITTPAWTSLFARAAAVVTDIGGPLSHSSIVAREYGIPAVLGTNVGTRRIVDGQRITVDGDAGKVHLVASDPDAGDTGTGDAGGVPGHPRAAGPDSRADPSRSGRPRGGRVSAWAAGSALALGAVFAGRAIRRRWSQRRQAHHGYHEVSAASGVSAASRTGTPRR